MTSDAPAFDPQAFHARAFDARALESLNFESRHIGPSPAEQKRMLAATGHASLDELTQAALPPGHRGPAAAEPAACAVRGGGAG